MVTLKLLCCCRVVHAHMCTILLYSSHRQHLPQRRTMEKFRNNNEHCPWHALARQ